MAEYRSIWSGTISFVLVNIPVRLYTAISHDVLNFDLLHKKDNSRIRYARFCKQEEKEVPYEELTRGFEYQKGEYVIISPEDFEKADPKRSRSIDIIEFVKAEEIDSIYFSNSYYLEPDEGAEKTFALFIEALKKTGKVAVGTFIMRERQHLAMLRPYKNVILLEQMHYTHEIRNPSPLKETKVEVAQNELELATSLIDKLTSKFDPVKFKDTYYDVLKKIIDEKAKGEKVVPVSVAPTATDFEDLMAKLKESLEKTPAK